MNKTIAILQIGVLLATMSSLGSCGPTTLKATDPDITYMGRRVETPEGNVRFNYPGFTVMLNFSGTSLDMHTSPGSGYWMVETDDGPAKKMFVAPGDSVLTVARNLEDRKHKVRITYCVEGYKFKPEVKGFVLADGGKILPAPTKGYLKMEFIGDSMTCGYGTEDDNPENNFSYETENHFRSYAYIAARKLDADVNMVCRSGIGVYRNYDGPKEGSDQGTMPMEYENALLYEKDTPWDFSSFIPDVVCVNLGTNDTSTKNYDLELYEKSYRRFVKKIRALYPRAMIVLLTGSMMNGQELADTKAVLDRIAYDYCGVYRFDMTPQDGTLGYGADYHPSARQSYKMAEELVRYIRSLLSPPRRSRHAHR